MIKKPPGVGNIKLFHLLPWNCFFYLGQFKFFKSLSNSAVNICWWKLDLIAFSYWGDLLEITFLFCSLWHIKTWFYFLFSCCFNPAPLGVALNASRCRRRLRDAAALLKNQKTREEMQLLLQQWPPGSDAQQSRKWRKKNKVQWCLWSCSSLSALWAGCSRLQHAPRFCCS